MVAKIVVLILYKLYNRSPQQEKIQIHTRNMLAKALAHVMISKKKCKDIKQLYDAMLV